MPMLVHSFLWDCGKNMLTKYIIYTRYTYVILRWKCSERANKYLMPKVQHDKIHVMYTENGVFQDQQERTKI